MNLARFNELAALRGAVPEFSIALLSIHGIKTTGHWQKHIAVPLQRAGILYATPDWGYRWLAPLACPRRTADAHAPAVVNAWREHDGAGLHL
ncbi:MAG: hypothetical protein R2708_23475 [Vicinamibacterales bacterium]